PAMIGTSLDGTVLVDRSIGLDGTSADHAYVVRTDDGYAGMVVTIAQGPSLYLAVYLTDTVANIDGEAFGEYIGTVVLTDIDAEPPAGYSEIPMDDDLLDDSDPFDALESI